MTLTSADQLLLIEAIKRLKYVYLRAVDTHDWDLLESTLSEDVVARYDGGKYSYDNRKALIDGLRGHMDSPSVITMHNGHHPEIELLSDTEATGKWYLQDLVFNKEQNWMLFGTAIYTDHYRLENGDWKIYRTEYERIMETINAPIPATLSFTHNMFETK
ncbi:MULTISPECIES: nuclear transport factor 2 family protein [Spongiibacter]|uniref:nuclear transport factor 2 family protein n=1 Tax=Spongiibacter TaxID=630749 RepID=UPI0003B73501|nr:MULTISPECIES: nuclear transport factor 2 family protein [Spongiibacter]MAY39326.1 nuclear transport factor 2 family protein [Spongiibacter sp.]MBI58964.1 nuclear transport factor 2 family protein [Spongiibacter sp.]MBU72561.1 nuclear transport factor 2 family protein [Spongiibacter sp.]|tara:strand:- start:542 stop:1021 length:480 start_codon:yes stop_codon:yes gene_type:complete